MPRPRGWLIAGVTVAALGALLRVVNAVRYPIGWGFDGLENWNYIRYLTRSWALPAPDAGWSTGHPPLFYYLAAALCRALGTPERDTAVIAVRLASTAAGLLTVGLAVMLVRRVDPENPARAFLAGCLLLFLPVHIYMCAMLSEEILVSTLASLVLVGVGLDLASRPRRPTLRAATWGAAGGLALATKLSGLLVIAAAAGAYAFDGLRRREWQSGARRACIVGIVAIVVGGGWYARNQLAYGYLYPYALPQHQAILEYPPGERKLNDYIRIPFATWTDPRALSPSLLRSVPGTTYASIWYDVHRQYLPSQGNAANRIGTFILVLALLPTSAFAVGLWRGLKRLFDSGNPLDALLLLTVGLSLAGYVLFTWRNPFFPAVKGSFLLGLSVPFAFYTSEILAEWTHRPRAVGIAVRSALAILFLAVAATFTQGVIFEKTDYPGFLWKFSSERVFPLPGGVG
jgi:hypothetical protein